MTTEERIAQIKVTAAVAVLGLGTFPPFDTTEFRKEIHAQAETIRTPLERYRLLEDRLRAIRNPKAKELGQLLGLSLQTEEDIILDEMDLEWYNLTDEQQALIHSEGPVCWPEEGRNNLSVPLV